MKLNRFLSLAIAAFFVFSLLVAPFQALANNVADRVSPTPTEALPLNLLSYLPFVANGEGIPEPTATPTATLEPFIQGPCGQDEQGGPIVDGDTSNPWAVILPEGNGLWVTVDPSLWIIAGQQVSISVPTLFISKLPLSFSNVPLGGSGFANIYGCGTQGDMPESKIAELTSGWQNQGMEYWVIRVSADGAYTVEVYNGPTATPSPTVTSTPTDPVTPTGTPSPTVTPTPTMTPSPTAVPYEENHCGPQPEGVIWFWDSPDPEARLWAEGWPGLIGSGDSAIIESATMAVAIPQNDTFVVVSEVDLVFHFTQVPGPDAPQTAPMWACGTTQIAGDAQIDIWAAGQGGVHTWIVKVLADGTILDPYIWTP